MKKLMTGCLVAMLCLQLLPAHTSAASSGEGGYGAWMWDASIVNAQVQEPFFEELDALNITNTIINVGYDPKIRDHMLLSSPENYNAFIGKLHAQGREVQALYGNSDWTLDEFYWHFEKNVKYVLSFNREYENKFDALHLDIEPHTFSDWESNKESYLTQYLNNIGKIKALIDAHNEANGDDLKLVLVLPYWIHSFTFSDGRKFLPQVFMLADEVAVMDYTRYNHVYIEAGVAFLEAAEAAGKKVSIGSEFLHGTAELDAISLYDFSREDYDTYIANGLNVFKNYSSFKQLAVHTFEAYKEYIQNHPVTEHDQEEPNPLLAEESSAEIARKFIDLVEDDELTSTEATKLIEDALLEAVYTSSNSDAEKAQTLDAVAAISVRVQTIFERVETDHKNNKIEKKVNAKAYKQLTQIIEGDVMDILEDGKKGN